MIEPSSPVLLKGEIVEIGVNVNYYDSDTVYFAVTK